MLSSGHVIYVGVHRPACVDRVVVAERKEAMSGEQSAGEVVPARPPSLASMQADNSASRLSGGPVEVLTGGRDGLPDG